MSDTAALPPGEPLQPVLCSACWGGLPLARTTLYGDLDGSCGACWASRRACRAQPVIMTSGGELLQLPQRRPRWCEAIRRSSSYFVLSRLPDRRILLDYAPAIVCRDASSSPQSRLGMAQRIGCVRLYPHGWPDGGRARGPRWRAVARVAAAGHRLPRSGHGTPALGRGDGPARCRDPARTGRQACRLDAAHVAPQRATRWSVLAVRDVRLNRRR